MTTKKVINDEVSSEAVADFLKETNPGVLLPKEDQKELEALLESEESVQIEAEDDTQRIEVPADPMYDPNLDTRDSILEWARLYTPVEDLELTEDEKDKFLRAALHDKPVLFDIPVLNGASVRCRALYDYEIEVMYAALDMDKQDGLVKTDVDFFSRMQGYGVLMQIVAVDGTPADFVTIEKPADVLQEAKNIKQNAELLRGKLSTVQYTPAKAATLRVALRMFSAKMKLALENIANADFWKPAVVD